MGIDEDGDYEVNFMRRLETVFSSLKKSMQHPLGQMI